jgi:hypothetical protein
MGMTGLFLFFVFLGQDCLQHIARFGDMRKIDLRNDGRRGVTRGHSARVRARLPVMGKVRTDLLRFVQFQRARVSLHSLDA